MIEKDTPNTIVPIDNMQTLEIERMQLKIDNYENKIEFLEKEVKMLKTKLKEEKTHKTELKELQNTIITDLKDDKQHYKSIVTSVNTNNTQSLSTINFLTTHRNSAPPLEELTTTTAKLCIEYDNDDLIQICISHQRHNSLHTFIGNIIASCYKTADPMDQSIWNSDVSRLTFIIRDKVKNIEGKKGAKYVNKWIQDKKGVTVNKRIVTPILKFLRNTLDSYSKSHGQNICKLIYTDPYKYAEEAEKIGYANKIISTIASGKLAKRISTHIGAQFQLDNKSLCDDKYINANDDNSDSDSNSTNFSSSSNSSTKSIVPKKTTIKKKY
jgi:hypothetical protein